MWNAIRWVSVDNIQCNAVITRSMFFKILIIDTPYLTKDTPYLIDVSFVSLKSDLRSLDLIAVPYVISWEIEPCYNDT